MDTGPPLESTPIGTYPKIGHESTKWKIAVAFAGLLPIPPASCRRHGNAGRIERPA
jgi:hypothetical protein